MARKKPADTAADTPAVIPAIKGFNADLTCQGFQFELGASFCHEGKVECCRSGFHAIEGHPLEVFSYYPPASSRYARVEMAGEADRKNDGDSKIASAEIRIGVELHLPELIALAVKYVTDRVKWIDGPYASGEKEATRSDKPGGAATASGYGGAATASGDCGAATASGEQGAATASGWRGAATASGWRGAATASGNGGAATASGRWGAATASGTRGAATASGTCGAATASGTWGAATATGYEGKARGKDGCALFLVERSSYGEITYAWAGIAGRDGIKPDTFYTLKAGQPVEAG